MWQAFLWWIVLSSAAPPAAGVVGGAPAAAPEPDSAVIFVHKHGVSARLEGHKDDQFGYYSFFGIRYAEPPVGPRRFQRPVRRILAGELFAKQYCQSCPQPDSRNNRRIIGNEDCLCINIYAPKMPGEEEGSPVVFFIHGGNYRTGSSAAYGGQHLTQKDTILVTAQYRLGSLGYFSSAARDASGNAGLFDLRAAMAWVHDYIEFFGGDPNRIIVMGQGSGGSAASLLALSSEGRAAKGVVALSGAPLSPGALRPQEAPARHADHLANQTHCPPKPVERLVSCLRKLSVDKIILADTLMSGELMDTKSFIEEISGLSGAGARVEGAEDLRGLPPLVAEQPSESIRKKQQQGPLLTGVNSAETSRAVYGKYGKFLKNQLAAAQNYIKKDVIGGLRGAVATVGGLVPVAAAPLDLPIPLQDYYQSLFDNTMNAIDGLSKIAEATGDALFNFPAYQSVTTWSEGNSAYLYSFEHLGNLTRGSHFLPGVPLAENVNSNESDIRERANLGPAHGDELAYIFEPLDDNGQPIEGVVSSTDARVRNNFVSLISKFAHHITPKNKSNKAKTLNLMPFSKENNEFIRIKEGITTDKNFRFCQMGLWGNMAERLTGSFCKNLLGSLLNLPKVTVPVNLPITPKIPILNNIFVNDKKLNNAMTSKITTEPPKQVIQVTRRPTQKPPGLGLGLLNGILNI